MVFEIGKYYKHTTGVLMHVLCEEETTMYGKGLLADGGMVELFTVVGNTEDAAVNWVEIGVKEWEDAWLNGEKWFYG